MRPRRRTLMVLFWMVMGLPNRGWPQADQSVPNVDDPWSALRFYEKGRDRYTDSSQSAAADSIDVWSGREVFARVDLASAALFLRQAHCETLTFTICVARTTSCVTLAQPPSWKDSSEKNPRALATTTRMDDLDDFSHAALLDLTAESCSSSETRTLNVNRHWSDWKTYTRPDVFVIFQHAQSSRWRPGFATVVTRGLRLSPKTFIARTFNWFAPAAGIHAALIDFNPSDGTTVELGIGASASLFDGAVSFGWGVNTATGFANAKYVFVGTSIPELVKRAKHPTP